MQHSFSRCWTSKISNSSDFQPLPHMCFIQYFCMSTLYDGKQNTLIWNPLVCRCLIHAWNVCIYTSVHWLDLPHIYSFKITWFPAQESQKHFTMYSYIAIHWLVEIYDFFFLRDDFVTHSWQCQSDMQILRLSFLKGFCPVCKSETLSATLVQKGVSLKC